MPPQSGQCLYQCTVRILTYFRKDRKHHLAVTQMSESEYEKILILILEMKISSQGGQHPICHFKLRHCCCRFGDFTHLIRLDIQSLGHV